MNHESAGPLVCRRARAEDLPVIVAMLADDALGRGREDAGPVLNPAYPAAFEAIDRDPNQLLAVAEVAGAVVGTLQISFLPGLSHRGAWRGEIEAVRIDERCRGQGRGRQMLLWAVEQCRAHGCRLVQLTTNAARTDAQRFYRQIGFEQSHIGFKYML